MATAPAPTRSSASSPEARPHPGQTGASRPTTVILPDRTTDLATRRRLKAEIEVAWARLGEATSIDGSPHFVGFGLFTAFLPLEGVWADVRELERETTLETAFRWLGFVAALGAMSRYQGVSELAREGGIGAGARRGGDGWEWSLPAPSRSHCAA